MALPTLYATMQDLPEEVRVIVAFDLPANGEPSKPIVLYFGPDEEDGQYSVASFLDGIVWFHDPPEQLPLPLTPAPQEEPEPSKAST